jgi:hypothetical protein
MGRRLAVLGVSLLAALAIAALSRLPFAEADPVTSVVRLSWRTQGVQIRECRQLTEEELARIPEHMRRTEECVGRVTDYELVVAVDGALALVDTVSPSGARRDRPVYVFRDLSVSPGPHTVEVTFVPLLPPDLDGVDGAEALTWDGTVDLTAGERALITLDAAGASLLRRDAER